MRNSMIIFKKQLTDTLKNKTVLIQFILFPVMTLIMENTVKMEGMPELFFTKLFSVMYMGMAPLTSMAAIISEEKEKNTLRVLMMANVKPVEYLMGVGVYVWLICMAGAGVMAAGFKSNEIPFYMLVMGTGFAVSVLAGACIGIFAKNQMVATSIYMPVMMILSFAPMLAMFNENIRSFSKIFYTQQIRNFLNDMSFCNAGKESVIILALNAALAVILFFIAFRKKGLE